MHSVTAYTEEEIIQEVQYAFQGKQGLFYPPTLETDKVYNFVLDLEKAYGYVAHACIHLFADNTHWAIVFESNDYDTRGLDAQITLNYIGNCIQYPIQNLPQYRIVSNTHRIPLITFEEFYKVEVKDEEGNDLENGQLLAPGITEVIVKGTTIPIDFSSKDIEDAGIAIRKLYNPDHLIDFPALLRYINQIRPEATHATDMEVRTCIIPQNVPKILTITDFHYVRIHNKSMNLFDHEMFQLIAKVLCSKDPSDWKPTATPNNHWKNWTSGNL